jgi:3-oxoacyl-(acyl-carrier-protein) synthase
MGDSLGELLQGMHEGRQPFSHHPPLAVLGDGLAGVAPARGFRRRLKQRKAAKLIPPAGRLALEAAGQALDAAEIERADLGLFVGVGREPPDDGEAEASLAASCTEGRLDVDLLNRNGRPLYPPLLPLKTLPNMVLAHIAIHLGICGENGCWAGGSEAGVTAFQAAYWSVAEGRSPAALAGAADSLISLGLARDRLREGAQGYPGEGAAFFLLESLAHARELRRTPLAVIRWEGGSSGDGSLHREIGDCGAANALLHLATVLTRQDRWMGFNIQREQSL